jgi:hypothetical protein
MEFEAFEIFVSRPRLARYLISCSYSQERAMKLYAANIRVSQAFYPILNLFEIFLRNGINEKLSSYFADHAWIINQKDGFMNDASLGPKYWIKTQVVKAEINLKGKAAAGNLIAEQTFGFWTSLFEPRHYKLISGVIIQCFSNKPRFVNRNSIAVSLKEIREFRNRIYHNEAICFNGITIDFTQAIKIKKELYDLLVWMDTDLMDFVHPFDSIDSEIENALRI